MTFFIRTQPDDPKTEQGALDIMALNPGIPLGPTEIQAIAIADELDLPIEAVDHFLDADMDYL